MLMATRTQGKEFWAYSHQLAEQLSSPSIMFHATLRDGTPVTVDDYREAYWWLRDHTPEDSRVMAWWDYGYQITGIGNRCVYSTYTVTVRKCFSQCVHVRTGCRSP